MSSRPPNQPSSIWFRTFCAARIGFVRCCPGDLMLPGTIHRPGGSVVLNSERRHLSCRIVGKNGSPNGPMTSGNKRDDRMVRTTSIGLRPVPSGRACRAHQDQPKARLRPGTAKSCQSSQHSSQKRLEPPEFRLLRQHSGLLEIDQSRLFLFCSFRGSHLHRSGGFVRRAFGCRHPPDRRTGEQSGCAQGILGLL